MNLFHLHICVANIQNLFIIIALRCRNPPIIANADFKKTKWIYEDLYLPDTQVEYMCKDELTMVPDKFEGRICGNYSKWNAIPFTPSCVRGEFEILQFIESLIILAKIEKLY